MAPGDSDSPGAPLRGKMSFQDELMRAEAIREIRASGCTTEGIAELIVDFHGAVHILTHVANIQKLGEEVAASDTEQGAKMRQLLHDAASKAEAIAQQKAAVATPAPAVPAQLERTAAVPEDIAAKIEEAVAYVVLEGHTDAEARRVVAEWGYKAILATKREEQAENEQKASTSTGPQAVPTGGSASATEPAPNAAAASDAPPAAAGTSAASSQGAASETGSQREGQAQGS